MRLFVSGWLSARRHVSGGAGEGTLSSVQARYRPCGEVLLQEIRAKAFEQPTHFFSPVRRKEERGMS